MKWKLMGFLFSLLFLLEESKEADGTSASHPPLTVSCNALVPAFPNIVDGSLRP